MLIECIRVDGTTDEGPFHLEVQYCWTVRHIQHPTAATLVTRRNSGASYLNCVELQNGCLALGHANLFIPSNVCGMCFDPTTGKVDEQRLKQTWTRPLTFTSMMHHVVIQLSSCSKMQTVVRTKKYAKTCRFF